MKVGDLVMCNDPKSFQGLLGVIIEAKPENYDPTERYFIVRWNMYCESRTLAIESELELIS